MWVRVYLATSRRVPCGRVAALGEALSVTFRVTLVQTVSRRPVTIPHDLSRPPHRQRRPDRSPRRPGRFSRPPLWRFWRRQRPPEMARRSGPSSAVSCISRPFRAFTAGPGCCIVHGDQDTLEREPERACNADSAPACINLCSSTPRESSTASALVE